MIFCHPQAKFFHRKIVCSDSQASSSNVKGTRRRTSLESTFIMKETAAAAAEGVVCEIDSPPSDPPPSSRPGLGGQDDTSAGTFYVSSIFIGLSFCNLSIKSADVTPSILDFIYRVNMYERKKSDMGITVTPLNPDEIPRFVFELPPNDPTLETSNMNRGGDDVCAVHSDSVLPGRDSTLRDTAPVFVPDHLSESASQPDSVGLMSVDRCTDLNYQEEMIFIQHLQQQRPQFQQHQQQQRQVDEISAHQYWFPLESMPGSSSNALPRAYTHESEALCGSTANNVRHTHSITCNSSSGGGSVGGSGGGRVAIDPQNVQMTHSVVESRGSSGVTDRSGGAVSTVQGSRQSSSGEGGIDSNAKRKQCLDLLNPLDPPHGMIAHSIQGGNLDFPLASSAIIRIQSAFNSSTPMLEGSILESVPCASSTSPQKRLRKEVREDSDESALFAQEAADMQPNRMVSKEKRKC